MLDSAKRSMVHICIDMLCYLLLEIMALLRRPEYRVALIASGGLSHLVNDGVLRWCRKGLR